MHRSFEELGVLIEGTASPSTISLESAYPRRRYGADFESAGGADARAHVKFTLFQGLSGAVELRYRADIRDHLVDVREGRAADAG